ncbi:hypothetical protein H8N03_25985, partial [Ramlibacter sp. USB13]
VAALQESISDFVPADFSSDEGERTIHFGDKVRLANDYANGGTAGGVYEYMGTTQLLDLGEQDYADLGYWKEWQGTQLIPDGLNFTNSDSVAGGGVVVLNDLRSSVEASMTNVIVTAANVALSALESATVLAVADSSVESSGGSSFTGQGTSLAVNATIATNTILSEAAAFIEDSDVTTTNGDVAVAARNDSNIEATTLAAATSGANAVGVLLAFNTVGWKTQNVLFNSVDALLGDPLIANAFANQSPASVRAYLLDTTVDAEGAVVLVAESTAHIAAEVSNTATSAPAAIMGAGGMSAAFVLSSNMVNSTAEAYIDFTTAGAGNTIAAASVDVTASDDAAITAGTSLESSVSPTNDAAAGIINGLAGVLLDDYQYTSNSGVVDVTFGQRVRVADDFADADRAGKVY